MDGECNTKEEKFISFFFNYKLMICDLSVYLGIGMTNPPPLLNHDTSFKKKLRFCDSHWNVSNYPRNSKICFEKESLDVVEGMVLLEEYYLLGATEHVLSYSEFLFSLPKEALTSSPLFLVMSKSVTSVRS